MADLRESLTINATAELVYGLVADLPRMGEWSPECERVTWRGGATRAAEGAQFIGHNKAGMVRWMTQGEVVTAEAGRRLAFEISFGPLKIARWEYVIVPGAGDLPACNVTEEWTDRRSVWHRTPADLALGSRLRINQRGMVETLANLRQAAEAATKHGAPSGC